MKTNLIILDGFGINSDKKGNAISLANTPNFDLLFSGEYSKLDASGLKVGLPQGQMGNSEVGHMSIGSGRLIEQNLVKISNLFKNSEFNEYQEYKDMIHHAIQYKSTIHLLQLFGNGGVHAYGEHLTELLKIIPSHIEVRLHLFGDGRDVGEKSMLFDLEQFIEEIKQYKNVLISSISGRYYAMDRDNNWDRIEKAYRVIVRPLSKSESGIIEYIGNSYSRGITDEFIEPISFTGEGISDDDVVFVLNYRSDRAWELTDAIYSHDFCQFERINLNNIFMLTMTQYNNNYTGNVFIKSEDIKNTLSEIISKNDLKQMHLAETEKFAHVTKFFNGGKQIVYSGEDDILIKSPDVATYDLKPEMSAHEIFDVYKEKVSMYDFSVVNFANGDMVGHTGDLEASIKAVETLDYIIGKIIDISKTDQTNLLITADHGNCESMIDFNGNVITSHTTNLVPFCYIKGGEFIGLNRPNGTLGDIAPTILDLMGIQIPSEMTGKSLINKN